MPGKKDDTKPPRQRPVYVAERIDGDLPEDITLPRSGPRMDPRLKEALQVAAEDPGAWYCVGVYTSDTGARNTQKRFQRHELELPKGEWELESRRSHAEDGVTRHSKLYAKFCG